MECTEKEFQFLAEESETGRVAGETEVGWDTTAGYPDKCDTSSSVGVTKTNSGICLETDKLVSVEQNEYVTSEEFEKRHFQLGGPETNVYQNQAATERDVEITDGHQYESFPEPEPGLSHCPSV